MSSKPGRSAKALSNLGKSAAISAARWGRRRGCRAAESPACCRFPASARAFPGSTPGGGHNTPSDLRQFVAQAARALWPVVVSFGAMVPCGGTGCVGAQPAGAFRRRRRRSAPAASTAPAAPARAAAPRCRDQHAVESESECFIRMQRQRPARCGCSAGNSGYLRICDSGSAKNAPSAASAGARRG